MTVAAVAAYVVATVVLGRAQAGVATPAKLLLPVLPGVVLGAVVPDWRVLLVPAVALVGVLLVSLVSDPGCDSCGFTGSWTVVVALGVIVFGAAAAALGIGILGRRAIDRRLQDGHLAKPKHRL
jgi:hypothetical protein